jgi:type III pantothenate kinase
MKLLVDAGNTRIKWAVDTHGQFEFCGAHEYKQFEFVTLANEIWHDLTAVSKVCVANVAGDDMQQQIADWVNFNWQCDVEFIKPELSKHGVSNQYATPYELGADRWADAVAAWHECQHAVAIFDAGTSITLDILDQQGNLLGGTITPGINMMIDSLLKGAVGLRDTLGLNYNALRGSELIMAGKDTRENILNGCLLPVIAHMELVAVKLQQQLGNPFKCFVTGGDSEILMPHLSEIFEHRPYLVLEGIAILS